MIADMRWIYMFMSQESESPVRAEPVSLESEGLVEVCEE